MIGYGGGFPHILILMLVGFLWLIVIAVVLALLFVTIRFAVLGALKAHTRWQEAGKPSRSAWDQRAAPHPGFAPAATTPSAAPSPQAEPSPADPAPLPEPVEGPASAEPADSPQKSSKRPPKPKS